MLTDIFQNNNITNEDNSINNMENNLSLSSDDSDEDKEDVARREAKMEK